MWNPLKKQWIDRPSPARPCLTIAEDYELDMAVQSVKGLERRIKLMDKEMRKYLDTIQHLDAADQSLTRNLTSCNSALIHEDYKKLANDYHFVTSEMGKVTHETIDACYKAFVEPLSALNETFPRIKTALNKREELVTTWKTAHNSLKKYQEKKDKTPEQYAKLQKHLEAEELASKELKTFHTNLLNDLSMFLKERLDYLKPSVNAFITIQLLYYSQSTELLTKLTPGSSTDAESAGTSHPESGSSSSSILELVGNIDPESGSGTNPELASSFNSEPASSTNPESAISTEADSTGNIISEKEYQELITDRLNRLKSLVIIKSD